MKNKFFILILLLSLFSLTSCVGIVAPLESYNSVVVFSSTDIVNGRVEILKNKSLFQQQLKYFSPEYNLRVYSATDRCHSVNDREGTYFILEENESSDIGYGRVSVVFFEGCKTLLGNCSSYEEGFHIHEFDGVLDYDWHKPNIDPYEKYAAEPLKLGEYYFGSTTTLGRARQTFSETGNFFDFSEYIIEPYFSGEYISTDISMLDFANMELIIKKEKEIDVNEVTAVYNMLKEDPYDPNYEIDFNQPHPYYPKFYQGEINLYLKNNKEEYHVGNLVFNVQLPGILPNNENIYDHYFLTDLISLNEIIDYLYAVEENIINELSKLNYFTFYLEGCHNDSVVCEDMVRYG